MLNLNPNLSEIMQSDKKQLQRLAYAFFEQVDNGDANALEALIAMRKCKEVFEQAEAMIKPLAEKNDMPGRGVPTEMYGAKCEQAEAGMKYDYSQCNDLIYVDILQQETKITELKKQRETLLKTCRPGEKFVTDDGESFEVQPPVKKSSTIIKITLK